MTINDAEGIIARSANIARSAYEAKDIIARTRSLAASCQSVDCLEEILPIRRPNGDSIPCNINMIVFDFIDPL